VFNFPSAALQSGLEQFDWQTVGSVPIRYRVQHPQRLVAADDHSTAR
jgi:hypothetical protein